MKFSGSYLLFYFLLTVCPFITPRAQSVNTQMGAARMGMGAISSVIGDEYSVHNNTAGLAMVKETRLGLSGQIQPGIPGANRSSVNISIPQSWGCIGLGLFRFGDKIYNEQLLSAGYASKIGNTSLGIRMSCVQYSGEQMQSYRSAIIDFGGITQITPLLTLGALITNLTQSKIRKYESERITSRLIVGIALHPSSHFTIYSELEKDLAFQNPTTKCGVDWRVNKKFNFRTGFNLHPAAAFWGLGCQGKKVKVDQAIRYHFQLGISVQTSLSIVVFKKK